MNKSLVLATLSCFVIIATSCKSKKVIVPPAAAVALPTTSELLIAKVTQSENHFGYYSAQGPVMYKDAQTEQNLDVSIVMEKDRYVWMSVTALLGIEAARMKFTPDSIIILDRLHRKCIVANYSYLEKMTGIEMNLGQLQQLFAGNSVLAPDEKLSIVDTLLTQVVIYTTAGAKQTAYYNNNLKLTKGVVEDQAHNRAFTVEYPNYYMHGDNYFPSQININIRAEKNAECKIRLNNFAFDKKKDVQFSIPGSYEIIKP